MKIDTDIKLIQVEETLETITINDESFSVANIPPIEGQDTER